VSTLLKITIGFLAIHCIFPSTPSQAETIYPTKINSSSILNGINKTTKLRPELKNKTQRFSDRRTNHIPSKLINKNTISNQSIVIDAIAKGKPKILLDDLLNLGLGSPSINGRIISGAIPLDSLQKLDALKSLNEVRPSRIITSQGSSVSKGDHSQKSDAARHIFNVDGNEITIGIISDSFDCLGGALSDKHSKDLPENILIIEEALECTDKLDEGRALMQIIHDVAPGAKLIFHSGSNGLANTANAILKLAFEYNVDIIIDDFKSFSSNFFQEDPISQAVNRVVKAGVSYVTAAGNSGRNSYQSAYNELTDTAFGVNAHDFDPSSNVDIFQRINVPEGVGFNLLLQWDSPAYSISGEPGAQTDLDIFIFNESHTQVLASSTFGNIGRDPVEFINFFNPEDSGSSKFDLMITKASGESPGLFKYIILNSIEGIISEYQTDSSGLFGHANSESSLTIGAANYLETPEFGVSPPLLQSYSSAGGTSLVFNSDGTIISNPSIPQKPDVVAPDNVNTTFFGDTDTDNDGKPNISGSSAAAPHAAGVVALLLESNPELQPVDIRQILQTTSIDIIQRNSEDDIKTGTGAGFDFDSGYGLINAELAVDMARNFQASTPEKNDGKPNEIIVNDINQTGGGIVNLLSLIIFSILLLIKKLNQYGLKVHTGCFTDD
jgi:subtilisin family serine protease